MATNVLHPGPPPLTQKACQAAIDVIDLVAAEVRGVDLIDVTPNVRRLWQEHVVVHYPRLGPDGRGFLAGADVMLANLQANLPRMTVQERQYCRQQWAQQLQGYLEFLQPVLDAAQSNIVARQAGGYAGNRGGAPSQYIAEILRHQQAAEAEAYDNGGAMMAEQVSQQNQAVLNQMLTNMATMRHQSMMAVAQNFKA